MTHRQDPLDPAIAFLAPGPLAAFAPQDTKSVGAFRDVIGRFDTLNVQKQPQRLPLPCPAAGKRPGFVFPSDVVVEQRVAARIPRPPLPHGGALRAHMTQPLELGVDPPTTARHTDFHTLCESFRRADEMRYAALPEAFPGLIDTLAITDQHTSSVMHELRTGGCGTVWVELKVGHCRSRHAPQPLPITRQEPRRLVNVVHPRGGRHLATGRVMGANRLRHPIHHVLERPFPQGYAE